MKQTLKTEIGSGSGSGPGTRPGPASGLRWGWVGVEGRRAGVWGVGLALALVGVGRLSGEGPVEAPGGLPVGSMVAFGGGRGGVVESEGWMVCDGRELAASAFPKLHAAIGRAWGGSEDGATFRLPDLRGRFVRGVNDDADGPMRDPDRAARVASATGGNEGNAVGTLQEDVTGPHTHPLFGASDAVGQGLGAEILRFYSTKIPSVEAPAVRNEGAVQPGEGAETRPRNVAVNWIIRVR